MQVRPNHSAHPLHTVTSVMNARGDARGMLRAGAPAARWGDLHVLPRESIAGQIGNPAQGDYLASVAPPCCPELERHGDGVAGPDRRVRYNRHTGRMGS